MPAFALHPRLAADTLPLADLPLCTVRLMNERRWPWAILVPRREGASQIHDLEARDRAALVEEIALLSRALERLDGVARVNVGALGNVVGQLHVHVVGRWPDDPAWPGPVWGLGAPQAYDPAAAQERAERLVAALERA